MRNKSIILLLICIILCIVPFIIYGNTYLVGGDDTRLYYIFPLQFLKNYTFNIISDNTLAGAMTGYASVAYFAPVFLTIWFFKFIPFLSTQMVLYGLNLALGFLFCFKLINLWIPEEKNKNFAGNIIASLFYVTSIYLVKTAYTNQLLSLYLVSVLPITLYLFIKGLRQRKIAWLLLSVLTFSFFTSTINTLPWSAAMLIVLLPFLLYEFWMQKRLFIIYAGTFIGIFFLLNFYWIFHIIYPYFHQGGLQNMLQYYSSTNFINDNIRIIKGVSGLYSPLNIPFTQMDTQFVTNFSLITVVQSIFFVCILVAGLFVSQFKKEKITLYFISLFSFLISWFLFSPNIGSYGTSIFLFFSNNIPFFTMFRNMDDKFALPLSFTYAIVLAVSLQIIFENVRNKKVTTSLLVILTVILLATSITNVSFLKKQINPESTFSGEFNSDYMHMVSYLQNLHNASRVAWFPLNSPTYASIEDGKYPGHFYSGLSPLRELANLSDYTGRFSFITQTDLFLGDRLFSLLDEKKYEQIGEMLQQRNTRYIIVDHQIPPTYLQSFYFGGDGLTLLNEQGAAFQKTILGSKIKDFGTRYSLYNINSRFINDKLYLTSSFQKVPNNCNQLSYKKIASYQYDIVITNLRDAKKLVFLDPYSTEWVLSLKSNAGQKFYDQGKNVLVYNYANGWIIDPKQIKAQYDKSFYTTNSNGSISLRMNLYFQPQKYTVYANMVSAVTLFGVLGYLLIKMIKK